MENTSNHLPQGVVAVYGDEASAQRAATALRSIGVAEADIHSGGPATTERRGQDGRDELEMDQAVNVDPEVVAATGIGTMAVAMPIGALLALPFALIPFGGWPLWLRAVCVAIAGALAAGAYATVMSVPILTPRKPQAAAGDDADGVVVRVNDYSTQIAQIIANENPVRVDVIDLTEPGRSPGDATGH